MTPTHDNSPEALVRSYKEIKADYAFDPDIFCPDDDRARAVKWIIDNRLSAVDKTIFLLYADLQSYRKLGKRMRISYVTVGREVLRIKAIIAKEYANILKSQKMNKPITKEAFEFFFSCIGTFNHYNYFLKEMWRRVEGYEDEDEAEVKCAFLSKWTYERLGIPSYPVGAAWCNYDGSLATFTEYLQRHEALFNDYANWVEKQR